MQVLDKLLCRVQIFTDRETRIENVEKTSFVIGKSPEADVFIADEGLNRTDIGVNVQDKNIFITVLESQNGSWLGDKQLIPKLRTRYTGEPLTLGSSKVSITLSLTGNGTHQLSPINLTLPPLPKYALEKLIPVISKSTPLAPADDPAQSDLEAEEIIAEALEQGQKEAYNILAEAQKTILELRANWELEQERRAKVALDNANGLIAQAKKDSEKILGEAKEEANKIHLKAESAAREILARGKALVEAQKTALEMKTHWELEQEHQAKAALDKAKGLIAQAEKDAERILSGAKNEAKLAIENTKRATRSEANEVISRAQVTADRRVQAAKSDAATLRLTALKESEEQKKILLAESLKDARKAADEILARAQTEANRTLDSVKAESQACEQLRKETEKFSQEMKESKTRAEDLVHQAELQRNKILDETKSKKQEILETAEIEVKGIKTKAETLKADAAKVKIEIENLKKEATKLKDALERDSEKSKANFLAAEKEQQEKITNLLRTVESTDSLLKQKTAEIGSHARVLQKKIEETLQAERELKILSAEKEKILKNIANLKRQRESEMAQSSAPNIRRRRSKSAAIVSCIILGLAAIFIPRLYQGKDTIAGHHQVPSITVLNNRSPLSVAVKAAPPPVAPQEIRPRLSQVQTAVHPPAPVQASAPVQAQAQAPVQTQALQPVSVPISISPPTAPVKNVTDSIKNSKSMSTAKNEKHSKHKPTPILPKTNPDERQRDLDSLQFSE